MQAVNIGTQTLANSDLFLSFADRPLGTILLGATGKGKTSLMERLIAQDMWDQTTAIIFDPHGELSERLLRIGSAIRPGNLLFCEITGTMSYGFNPLEVKEQGDPLEESQTIDSLMQVFRKHWGDNPAFGIGSRAEWVLSHSFRTILANPGYTLAEIPLLFSDKAFRDKLVRNIDEFSRFSTQLISSALFTQARKFDIWHKGHPNKEVMETRTNLFHLVGMLEQEPRQEYFCWDKNQVLAQHPDWWIFTDWEMYRASASMLKEGLAFLDQYYYDRMQHAYAQTGKYTPEEMNITLKIIQCLSGVLGIRPIMVPYIPEEHRLYLMRKIEEDTEYLAEKFHLINHKTGEKSYKLRKYEDELAGFPPPGMSVEMDPLAVPVIKGIAAEMRISPYEIENMIAWKVRELHPLEQEALTNYLSAVANKKHSPKDEYDHAFAAYFLFLRVWGAKYINDDSITDMEARLNKYGNECSDRAAWQIEKLLYFVPLWLWYTGYLLEKEPVFDTSHSYKEVEYNRRTYSDLREELVTKLVSLPPYQAICSLAGKSGELPVQILTPRPLPISPDAEPKAQAVREESKKKLGHPWQEVVKDIQTRQNLPPAKPHIPGS